MATQWAASRDLQWARWAVGIGVLILIAARLGAPYFGGRGLAGYAALHTILETCSIAVSALIFGVGWNAYSEQRRRNVVLLAIAFLCVAVIDLAHTLSYADMPAFVTPSGPEKAINFWLAARLTAAGALLAVALLSLNRTLADRQAYGWLGVGLTLTALIIWIGLFHADRLPRTFIAGSGLTPFKIGVEYVIVALNLVAAVMFYRQARAARARADQDHTVDTPSLFAAAAIMALGEFFFTLYSDVTDWFNLLGHAYKVVAAGFLYRGLVVAGVHAPYERLLEERDLFVNAPVGIAEFKDRILQRCNPRMEQIFGYGSGELIGRSSRLWYRSDEDWAAEGRRLYGIVDRGEYDYFEREFVRKDGRRVWCAVQTITLGRMGAHAPRLFSFTDITARKEAEREAEAKQRRFDGIIGSAIDAVITVDAQQNIVLFNAAAESIFRCQAPEVIGQPLDRLIPARHRAAHRTLIARFGESSIVSQRMGGERMITGLRSTGEEFPLDASISHAVVDGQTLYTVILRDISERKRAEEALGHSEQRYRGLFELSPQAVWIHRGRLIEYANKAALELFGATSLQELVGKSIYELFHPDSHDAMREQLGTLLADGNPQATGLEQQIVRLDGAMRYIEVAAARFEDENGVAIQAMARDVTARVQAQRQLEASHQELRELSAAMQSIREEERKHLARELHDDLGQLLAALKMDIGMLKAGVPTGSLGLVENIDRLASSVIGSTRRLINDLRPQALDESGLVPALEGLTSEFARRHGVRCELHADAEVTVDDALATPVYRVVQESLTNVAKHAQARAVQVSLIQSGGELRVAIQDDGRGLGAEQQSKRQSFGLLGMRERVHSLGGKFEVHSHAGAGRVSN